MHPRPFSGAFRSIPCILPVLFVTIFAGCDALPTGTDPNASRVPTSSREMPPVQSPVYEAGADNNDFAAALPATLPLEGTIEINGAIDTTGDVDYYMLGGGSPGDLIVVEVVGSGGLNLNAGLFDSAGDLIDANNDRAYYAGNYDPYIAQVLREPTGNLYVGVATSTATHFAGAAGSATGAYTIRISRRINQALRAARPQVVWLDFDGGDSVQIAQEPVELMRPFTAESISADFAGQTNDIVDLVVALMQHDLAGYNVVLYDSKHYSEPAEPHSTLYFGNFNNAYLGLADNVDTGNVSLAQKAIIYTEDLHLWEGLAPTAAEVAQAIANIAGHELGHLLGLEHTGDAQDLMATAGSANQVLEINATYRRAVLERSVFPGGWQNNPHLLSMNVGGNSNNARTIIDDLMSSMPNNKQYRAQRGLDIQIHMCKHE